MKIRIGNDVRILAKIFSKNQQGDVNIHSVKAYVINKTAQEAKIAELNSKTRFISRFPIEPACNCYTSTQYNINCSGCPSYYAFPKTYISGSYSGFGCNPEWSYKYKPVEQCDFTEFLAPTKATDNRSVVEILFPAESQLFTGDYKIVIVTKLYEPGFSDTNLRTVTVDYDNAFTLVSTSEEGIDTNVTVNIGDIDYMVELHGTKNVITGLTYSVTMDAISDTQIRWFCNEPTVKFLEQDNNHVLYTVESLPAGQTSMEFEIVALSADDNKIIGRLSVWAYDNSYVGDVYANSGSLDRNSGNVQINLNDGRSFNLDLSSELNWYEGN